MKTEQTIKVMEALGFKKYQSGKEVYFLPVAGKIKPMKKIKLEFIEGLFEDEIKEVKPKTVKPKTKKGGKKE